ncbi:MAG: VWA domain-containing protein [Betaproteobacteria bacterium]|nr:VWA domain-containing protein [Betaproteobacteria bacterium]
MQFLQPFMLWSLLLLPLVVWGYAWLLRRKRKVTVAFSAVSWILQNMSAPSPWRRHVPPALIGCALALLLFASARPMARVTLPADYMTLIMAMDVSRSMLAEDVDPSRIKAAQKAAREFLQDLPSNVRVGIISFAGNAQVVQHVTDQRQELVAAIDRFQLQRGTATGSGLLLALATLRPEANIDLEAALYNPNPWGYSDSGGSASGGASGGARSLDAKPAAKERPPEPAGSYKGGAIVLLTDGRRTTGPDPIAAAKKAADLGVRVYTVGFGTPNGFIPGYEGYTFYTQVDEEALKAVAKITEADYFKAGSADDLKQVYKHLSTQFTMEKRDTEITALLAGLALLLIFLALGLSAFWFKIGRPHNLFKAKEGLHPL